MRTKHISLALSLILAVQFTIAQKFPMPNQNVQDAFSLAGSIFTSYQGQKNYQNKINAIVKINTSISDPELLVREYTAKMNQLQREAEQRKQQKAAEVEKQVDLIKKGLEQALKAADVDLGPVGNLVKDVAAGVGKQVAINNANRKIEELKKQAEKELDEEMKKSMGAIYDKIVKENQDAQKEYLFAAAEVYSEREERHYIEYYNFFSCALASMKKNYNYKSADWLKTGCTTPPKSFFGISQQAPRFDYNKQGGYEEPPLEPDFAAFNPEAQIAAIEQKLQESLKKLDELISKTEDAFQKVEYMSLRQQLIEKAAKEKEEAKTGDVAEPEAAPVEEYRPQQKQYQPLLDCAIRKLALYKSEMPFPEFLDAAKRYAEAEIAENKRNPHAYIFLADLTDDAIEQYMLTGYALYLDKRNPEVVEKFKASKERFGKALFSAIENGDNSFVNNALARNLLNGFEHQGVTPFQYAIFKDNPDAMDKLMPANTDKYALIYYIIEAGGPKVTKRLLGSVDVNSIPVTEGYDPLTASVSFDKKDIAFTLLNGGFKYDNSLALASGISTTLFEKTVSVLSFFAIDKNNAQMLDFVVQKAPAVLKPQAGSKENLIDAIVKDNKTKLLPILVKHGLDVKNQQYAYLLELAINSDAEELALALVELGIDLTHVPAEGGSLVNLLVTKKAMNNLFDILLQKGVNISTRNNKNDLAIMTALHHGDVTKTRKLLEKQSPLDFYSKQSGNQIHWIVENGVLPECISLMVQFKIDINGKDKNGDSPLMFALKKQQPTYVRELLNAGASVSTTNEKNVTPLQFSIFQKSALFQDLLAKCDNPNVQGINGWTALHFAVREGNVDAVKKLLDANANPLVADNWGRTPYRVAREHGQEAIKKMLRKKMGLSNIIKTAYATNKKTPKV